METRLKKTALKGAALLAAGCAYFIWLKWTGIGIPCVFHLVTGLQCPGCGVSRMLISLVKLDFRAAFRHNAVLLCLTPVILGLLAHGAVRYIRTGERKMSRAENILSWVLVGILLAWGAVRNFL